MHPKLAAGQFREESGEIDLEPFRVDNPTGYRGVYWQSRDRKYQAKIKLNGQQVYIGSFGTAEEAARAHARVYLRQNQQATY